MAALPVPEPVEQLAPAELFAGPAGILIAKSMTMTTRTRYALLGGAGVMAVGLAGGLAAWVSSSLPSLVLAQERPDELRYVPSEATILSFANVREVMDSELRRRLREVEPELDGQREFQERTGIDIERDIEYVIGGVVPNGPDATSGIVILSWRFDFERLEALALEHGGAVGEHRGRPLITIAEEPVAMAFLESGVIAIGSEAVVRRIVDLPVTGGGVDSDDSLMGLLHYVDSGATAWTVGRFDNAVGSQWLPEQVESQVSQVAAFAAGLHVNGGVSGSLTAVARDEETGRNLRELLQGLLALARLQVGSRPELRGLLDSIRLTSAGTNVTLAFDLPSDAVLELLPDRSDADVATVP